MKRALLFTLIAGLILWVAPSCSKKAEEGGLKVNTGLAGRVDDIKITQEFMLRQFEALSEAQKNEFKGPDGQARFMDRIIEQHLFYKAAIDGKIDKGEEMQERIRWATMNIIVSEYFKKMVSEKIHVETEEVEEYYNAHSEEFIQAPVMRAQYLFTEDSLKAVSWKERLAKGENFTKIAGKESEEKASAQSGGDVGYFNRGGYIKGVVDTEGFSRVVDGLDVGETSGIVRLTNGFAIIKATEKNPEKRQTLEEARRSIEAKLNVQKTEAAYKALVDELSKKYKPENYVRERFEKTKRTAKELWEMAQIEPDARNRIQYYRDIVNQYPNDENAPEALFMIGFTYAEDLMDYVQARRVFDELEKKYPDSPLLESAKWMEENMEKGFPKLESFEDMQQRMEKDKARGEQR